MKKPFDRKEAIKHPEWVRHNGCSEARAAWVGHSTEYNNPNYVSVCWENNPYVGTYTENGKFPTGEPALELEVPDSECRLTMTVDDIKKLPANAWVKRKTHSRWYRITSIDDDGIYLYGDGFMTHTTFYAGYKYTLDGGETWNEFAPEV